MYLYNDTAPDYGIVIRKTRNAYLVRSGEESIPCTLSNRFLKGHDANAVVVGDEVILDEIDQITRVLPRHNQFSRRTAGAYDHEQVIAANVDQAVLVFAAANPNPAWNLLDRYLVSAESAKIPALICLTKLDLVEGKLQAEEIEAVAAEYQAIGYDVVLTSSRTGRSLDDLKARLRNRLSIFVGKSGVGKTSLLNAIEGGLGLEVQSISQATGKGRHTTSASQMFPLSFGGAVVDTPGIREFGLWDAAEDDLDYLFPEMRPYLGCCKFRDCHHDEEPGCAIRKAVMTGQISPYRYQSYLKMRMDP